MGHLLRGPYLRFLCWLWLAALAGVGALAGGAAGAGDEHRLTDHVIVVSVDGFANSLLWNEHAPLPFLRSHLGDAAVADDGMVCSFPTVTWPNHTTLVTGVSPAKHGVLANNVFDRSRGQQVQLILDPVFGKEELVRVPTVYDVAHRAGLSTAALAWPAVKGARTLDWLVPDMHTRDGFEQFCTPGLLDRLRAAGIPVDRYGAWLSEPAGGAKRDWLWTEAALYLLRRHRPNLMVIHYVEMDHVLHRYGPGTGDDLWVATYTDHCLRHLWEGAKAALGPGARLTLIVTSDHGFFETNRSINLGVFFKQLSLPDSIRTIAISQGGAAAIYLVGEGVDDRVRREVSEELKKVEGAERVFLPGEFVTLGQPTPDESPWAPDIWVAARRGYAFSGSASGDAVVTEVSPRGTHGYLPDHPDMRGVFYAIGAGVKPGKLGKVDNRSVAPTIARLLGLELPDAESPPVGVSMDPSR